MKVVLLACLCSLIVAEAAAEEKSRWWHGTFVTAGSDPNCDANDSRINFSADEVFPYETACAIVLQTDVRDMQGVLLDIDCSYPDSSGEGQTDRIALFELDDGNVMSYSRASRQAVELQRCGL